ncbi:chromate transporter [Leptospira hartskeerlii]|uniref:Chromate transporter n=1 Tax=Leptospira hartskeerlii TaxID=2023177 RepID=A0A2M9XDD7_9LEPT|nr:chromate efflux transporter [Leptospira hartskeerlii]PJZ25711.1 chromate transporter [Leptospira hartskeerlii]PJZ35466.1 chromate transporter [Leptospira hartskeerlii]
MKEVFFTFLKLGMISFGGPTAHLAYFYQEFVIRRKWISEEIYKELLAVCQFLPGPASSQLGICIGTLRSGWKAGCLAWIGFTLPSILLMIGFAILLKSNIVPDLKWIHGLKLVAASVVAHAILTMWKNSKSHPYKIYMVIGSAIIALVFSGAFTQLIVILIGAAIGYFLFKEESDLPYVSVSFSIPKKIAFWSLGSFLLLLLLLPLLRSFTGSLSFGIVDSFYRSGALVFGGGHVVLPLLENEVVRQGWIGKEEFLAGYGAAQAMPGPLFTFASYIGYMISGPGGTILSTTFIFLPSFLLVFGFFPLWEKIRNYPKMRTVIDAIQFSALGILLSAFCTPVLTSSIYSAYDLFVFCSLFALMVFLKVPNWLILIIGLIAPFLNPF